jgi:hypothetical protein
MNAWFEPLFEPSPLVKQSQGDKPGDPRVGLALLLEAQFRLYRAIAGDAGWPTLGEPADTKSDAGSHLLAAVGLHVLGNPAAEDEYRRAARSRRGDLKTIATVLLGTYLRDIGRPAEASALLRERQERVTEPLDRLFIGIHLGVRAAERGDWASAVALTRAAVKLGAGAQPTRWRALLRWIADYNVYAFNLRLGRIANPFGLRPRSEIPSLLRNDSLLAGGLAVYLERQFDATFEDPYSRTLSFRAEDSTETQLQAAVLRGDWLGSWSDRLASSQLLGRYQLMSASVSNAAVSPASLELLRFAGDEKGLRLAAHAASRMGPLAPVSAATSALVSNWQFGASPIASLTLLAEGADSLSDDALAVASSRMISEPRLFVEAWSHAPAALGAIAKSAPDSSQTEIASFVMDLIRANPENPGLVQGLLRTIDSVRWEVVAPAISDDWFRHATSAYPAGGDQQLLAVQVLSSLSIARSSEVSDFVIKAFCEKPDLVGVELIARAATHVSRDVRRRVSSVIAEALAASRAQAARGAWSLGGLDEAALSVNLISRGMATADLWDPLVAFLLDPAVAADEKTRALMMLASSQVRLPNVVRSLLSESVAEIGGTQHHFSGASDAFDAAKLQLGLRLGVFRRAEALARLLTLATGSPYQRIQCALTLAKAERRIGAGPCATLVLQFAADEHHEVRAAAARALPTLRLVHAPDELSELVVARMREQLAEQGTIVPLAALAGLFDAAKDGRTTLVEGFLKQVRQLANHHLSHEVRIAATRLLQQIS